MASSSFSFPSSSSTAPWKYDVFLSFRGPDVRTKIVDHLDDSLRRRGIAVFKDVVELERGRPISEILAAIEESRFSLIVFSENYASSFFCLKELDKIFECCCKEGARRHTAFPIFYHVESSEVQQQTGRYGEALLQLESAFKDQIDQVHRGRKAMKELAQRFGWPLKKDRGEVDFIREVVDHIHSKLRKSDLFSSIDAGDYIGMDSHLEKLSPYLNSVEESNDVRFVGICGMGGAGKSTLAKFVYSKLSCEFDGSSFLENIRVVQGKEGGLAGLQRQLLIQVLGTDKIHIWSVHEGMNEIRMRLSRKKVLVILDNVDHLNQLESLAGASRWFGNGSRIIITTRDEHLLSCHGVSNKYRMGELGKDEALKLFCWRAFRDYTPAEGFEELSKGFIAYASRLPLALTILGSYVCGRSINEWKSALDKLKKFPNKEILENLRISFDSLDPIGRKIFLDIACFFAGEDVNFLLRVLKSCEFYPDIGLRDLIDKSLVTISGNKVWMHDLVQQLGQEIVRGEHEEPGCRSRIWLCEDLRHILSNDTGSEQIEGIVLNVNSQEVHKSISSKSFLKMKKLRLLRLPNLCCLRGQEYLSNELRYLRGNGYPFEALPSSFHPDKLVELHLSHSNIKQLWKRKQRPLQMLKVINLSYSRNLIKTPDFSEVPNLEELILEGCTKLHEVHQSIGVLERLVLLNLKDCKSLKELPGTLSDLKSLKNLILHGCLELHKFPERLGDLTSLEVLDLGRGVASRQPSTRPLQWPLLPWKDPSSVALILPSLSTLRSLRNLNLSYCKLMEGAMPNYLDRFPLLERLNLGGNDFKSLPTSLGQLSKLQKLILDDCKMLQSLPDLPTSVTELSMDHCTSLETLPNNLSGLCKLKELILIKCKSLRTVPDLPSSIGFVLMDGCSSLEAPPDISGSHGGYSLSFLNCLTLTERQDLFGCLIKYLHSILKNKRQGLPSWDMLDIQMSSTGGGIPGWFNYVSEGASLKVELPPCWFNNGCLGFAVCVVFGFHDCPADDYYFYDMRVMACITQESPIFELLRKYEELWMDDCFNSYVVDFRFIPCGMSKSVEWWNSLSHLAVSIDGGYDNIYFDDDDIGTGMCIGLRIVYEQDVEELSRWRGTSSSPPFHNVVSTNKRSHDDGCSSDSQAEARPGSKRWKLEGDTF